jgi:hypothetical protein
MTKEDKARIEKIRASMKCPKNFRCLEFDLTHLCKAKDIGMKSYLECLEKKPPECAFALSWGDGYFCECPMRLHIAKKL